MKCKQCETKTISYRIMWDDKTSVTGVKNFYLCDDCYSNFKAEPYHRVFRCDSSARIKERVDICITNFTCENCSDKECIDNGSSHKACAMYR